MILARLRSHQVFFYLIVLLIFLFLVKVFFENWWKIKDFNFSFNYLYLIFSYISLFIALLWGAYVWNKILRILEPSKTLSYPQALKISVYSSLGRYLPGKVWMFAGRVYLGQKDGLPSKPLVMSLVYEVILSVAAGFLLALLLVGLALGFQLYSLYLAPVLVVAAGLFFSHPKILYWLFSLALRKFNRIEIRDSDFLNYWRVIQIIFYYFVIYIFTGLGFFFLVKSIVYLPFYDMMGVIGFYALSLVSGAIAIFSPDGLGVREGVLTITLQSYLPIGVTLLISAIARIWFTSAEVILYAGYFICDKFLKIKNGKKY